MSRFRKIDTRVWGDSRFGRLTPPPPCGQFLWMYLMAGPHVTNVPGIFRAGELMLAEELGWDLEGFRKAFGEVSAEGFAEGFAEAHAEPMAKADWKARVVWLPKALAYNRPESPNVVKGWSDNWDEIPDCPLKAEAWIALKQGLSEMDAAFLEAFVARCRKPSAKPSEKPSAKARANQEQEQEQEQEQISPSPRPTEPTEPHSPQPPFVPAGGD